VQEGAVNTEVQLKLSGGAELTAIITKESCHTLGLKAGEQASASFKPPASSSVSNNLSRAQSLKKRALSGALRQFAPRCRLCPRRQPPTSITQPNAPKLEKNLWAANRTV